MSRSVALLLAGLVSGGCVSASYPPNYDASPETFLVLPYTVRVVAPDAGLCEKTVFALRNADAFEKVLDCGATSDEPHLDVAVEWGPRSPEAVELAEMSFTFWLLTAGLVPYRECLPNDSMSFSATRTPERVQLPSSGEVCTTAGWAALFLNLRSDQYWPMVWREREVSGRALRARLATVRSQLVGLVNERNATEKP
ncbi:MAG TPA: hypothetical protein VMS55_01750 [Myxococcota bacterium]|nr:hypothetical protein [Myxococcota bacterium]